MNKLTFHTIRFFSPGSFCANISDHPGSTTDPYKVVWPQNAFCFQFIDREDVVDGDATYTGKEVQIGPTFFHPDSKIETLAEVRRNPKASHILITNMECNNWTHVVWSRWETNPQPFDPTEDHVLKG